MNKTSQYEKLQNDSWDKVSDGLVKLNVPANDNYEHLNWKNIIRLRHLHEPTAEKQLWKLVICQSIEDAIGKPNRGKKAKRLAIGWLTEENEDFKTVCALAGYEHETVKKNALKIIANETKKIQEATLRPPIK